MESEIQPKMDIVNGDHKNPNTISDHELESEDDQLSGIEDAVVKVTDKLGLFIDQIHPAVDPDKVILDLSPNEERSALDNSAFNHVEFPIRSLTEMVQFNLITDLRDSSTDSLLSGPDCEVVGETNEFPHPDTPPTTPSPSTQIAVEEHPLIEQESQIKQIKRQSSEALSDKVVETMNSITNLLTGMEEQEGFQLKNDEYHMEPEEMEVYSISLQSSVILECESLSDISRDVDRMSVSSLLDVDMEEVQPVSIAPPSVPVHPVQLFEGGVTVANVEDTEMLENVEEDITEDTIGTASHDVAGCETCEELSAESLVSDPEPLIVITAQEMVAVHSAPHPVGSEEKSGTSVDPTADKPAPLPVIDETAVPILVTEDDGKIAPVLKTARSVDEDRSLGTIEITVDADQIIAVQGMDTSNDSLDSTSNPIMGTETSESHVIPQDPVVVSIDQPEKSEQEMSEEDNVQSGQEDKPMRREEILTELGKVFVREETMEQTSPHIESGLPEPCENLADNLENPGHIEEANLGDDEDVPSSITVMSFRVEDQPSIEENSLSNGIVESRLADTSTDSLLTPDEMISSPEMVESCRRAPDIDLDFSLAVSGEKAVAEGIKEHALDDTDDQSRQAEATSVIPAEEVLETEQITRSISCSSSSSFEGSDGRKIRRKRRSGTLNYVYSAKSKEPIIHVEQPAVIGTEGKESDARADNFEEDHSQTVDDTLQSSATSSSVFLGLDEMENINVQKEAEITPSDEVKESNTDLDLSPVKDEVLEKYTDTNLIEGVGNSVPSMNAAPLLDNTELGLEPGEIVMNLTTVSSSSSSSSDSEHENDKDSVNGSDNKEIAVLTETLTDTGSTIPIDKMEGKAVEIELDVKATPSDEIIFNQNLAKSSDLLEKDSGSMTNISDEIGSITQVADDAPSSECNELEQIEVVMRKASVSSSSSSSSESDHEHEKDTEIDTGRNGLLTSLSDPTIDTASTIVTLYSGMEKVEPTVDLISTEVTLEEVSGTPSVEAAAELVTDINIVSHASPTIHLDDIKQCEKETEINISAEHLVGDNGGLEQTIALAPELATENQEQKGPHPIADSSFELNLIPPSPTGQLVSNETSFASNESSNADISFVDQPITPPQAILRRNSAASTSSSSSDSESESNSVNLVEHPITIAEMESDDSSICSESDLQESMQRFKTMKRSLSADDCMENGDRGFEADLETVTPDINISVETTAAPETEYAVKDPCEDVSSDQEDILLHLEDIHIPLSVILSDDASRKSSRSSSNSSCDAIQERHVSPVLPAKQIVDESCVAPTKNSDDWKIDVQPADLIQDIDVKAFVDSQIEAAVAKTLELDEKPDVTDEIESQQIIVTNTTFSLLSDVPDVQIIPKKVDDSKIISRKSSSSSSEDEGKFPELHLATKGSDPSQDWDYHDQQQETTNEESLLEQLESSFDLKTAAYRKSTCSSSSDSSSSDSGANKSKIEVSDSEEKAKKDDDKYEFVAVSEETKDTLPVSNSSNQISLEEDEDSRYGTLTIATEIENPVDLPPEEPADDTDVLLNNSISQPSIESSSSSSDTGSGSDGDGKTDLTEVTEIVVAETLAYEDEAEMDVPQAVKVSEESPTIDKIRLVNTPEESPTIDKLAPVDTQPLIDNIESVNTPEESPMIDTVTMIDTPDLLEADSDSDSLSEEEGFCESDAMQSILDMMTGSTASITGEEVEDELRSLSSSSSRSTVARNEEESADAETPEPPSERTGESRTTSAEPTEDSIMSPVDTTDDMRTPTFEPSEFDVETSPETPTLSPELPTDSLQSPDVELPSYSAVSEEIDVKEIEDRTKSQPDGLHGKEHADALTFLSQDSEDDITEDKSPGVVTNEHEQSEEKPQSQTLNDSSLGGYDLSSTMNTDPNRTMDSGDKLFLKTKWPKYDPVLGKSFVLACKVRLRGFELKDQDIKNNATIRLYKDEELLSVQPKFINGYFVFKIKSPTLAESGWYSFVVNMLDYEATDGQDINIALKGNKNKRTKSMSSIGSLGSLGSLFSVNNKTQNRR